MSDSALRERLLAAATAVRRALESGDDFPGFPHNYCNGASDVLGLYLINDLKIGPVEIVANGARPRSVLDDDGYPIEDAHLWLEVDGYIVDITADQFDDRVETVIVTTDRTWHDQFKGQARFGQADIIGCPEFCKEVYERIKARIER
jgi:hypothetical protein